MLRVCTWNINAINHLDDDRRSDIRRELKRIRADVLLLQEVGWKNGQHTDLLRELDALGYPRPIYTGRHGSIDKRYGNIIATRSAVPRREPTRWNAPWSQLLARATAKVDGTRVDIITVHIPNGTGNGWKKPETFEALSRVLWQSKDTPRILGGDFNEPREVRPNGQFVTFGQRVLKNGTVHANGTKTDKFRNTDTRRRWDAAVRSVLAGQSSHGLRSAYHAVHGLGRSDGSHFSHGVPKFFDHIFVSRHFTVSRCDYMHALRERGLSDHSPLVARLRRAKA